MITCKVGEEIINCIDNKYDKHKLKLWSDKNILVCPDCGKTYEYCHGEVIPPYFRHKEKSKTCGDIYSESETLEHIKGKTDIYNFLVSIKNKCGLKNIRLEYYIKETKQKPDIYFEQCGEKYVVEFQCTPIASEFIKRRELYKLAGINDIWILGVDKYYKVNKVTDSYTELHHGTRKKEIEKHTYLNYNIHDGSFIFRNNYIFNKLLGFKHVVDEKDFYSMRENIFFNCGKFELKRNILYGFYSKNLEKESRMVEADIRRQKIETNRHTTAEQISSNLNIDIRYEPTDYSQQYYIWKMRFKIGTSEYYLFIKDYKIDLCEYKNNYNFVGSIQKGNCTPEGIVDSTCTLLMEHILIK